MAPKPAANETHGRSLNRFTTVILIGYLAFIAALMLLLRRAMLSPEVFVSFAGVIAVMPGRSRAFVRDWAPLLLIGGVAPR